MYTKEEYWISKCIQKTSNKIDVKEIRIGNYILCDWINNSRYWWIGSTCSYKEHGHRDLTEVKDDEINNLLICGTSYEANDIGQGMVSIQSIITKNNYMTGWRKR